MDIPIEFAKDVHLEVQRSEQKIACFHGIFYSSVLDALLDMDESD